MTDTQTELFPSFSFKTGWCAFSTERNKTIGCWPNQLWANPEAKAGALVITKPEQYDEYPINQIGLNYVSDALQAGRIKHAFVVLARGYDRDFTVVAIKPVADVLAMLADIPTRAGRYGRYWWVCADFTPDGPRLLAPDKEF
jgi:hypothetical protein